MREGPLHGDDVTAGRDEPASIKVPQIVQLVVDADVGSY
jgi:hypothetical protein